MVFFSCCSGHGPFSPLCCFIQVQMSELLNNLRSRSIYLQEKAMAHSGRQIQKRQRGCRSFHDFAASWRCEIKGCLAHKSDNQERIYWGKIIWIYTINSNKNTSSEELFSFSLKPASCSFCLWSKYLKTRTVIHFKTLSLFHGVTLLYFLVYVSCIWCIWYIHPENCIFNQFMSLLNLSTTFHVDIS